MEDTPFKQKISIWLEILNTLTPVCICMVHQQISKRKKKGQVWREMYGFTRLKYHPCCHTC